MACGDLDRSVLPDVYTMSRTQVSATFSTHDRHAGTPKQWRVTTITLWRFGMHVAPVCNSSSMLRNQVRLCSRFDLVAQGRVWVFREPHQGATLCCVSVCFGAGLYGTGTHLRPACMGEASKINPNVRLLTVDECFLLSMWGVFRNGRATTAQHHPHGLGSRPGTSPPSILA